VATAIGPIADACGRSAGAGDCVSPAGPSEDVFVAAGAAVGPGCASVAGAEAGPGGGDVVVDAGAAWLLPEGEPPRAPLSVDDRPHAVAATTASVATAAIATA